MALIGNLFKVKLLQFVVPTIVLTLDIRSNHSSMGILKHAVNLFPRIIREKRELRQEWMLRKIGEESSPMCFDAQTSLNPIMNILI